MLLLSPKKLIAALLMAFVCCAFIQEKKLTVYLIGDSTMANKQVKAYPETGWGMPFASFFDQTITIDNRAQNGRSTKSFIAENRWQPVVDVLKEGDYVLIQFGHNDEVSTKATYTTEAAFKTNLMRFVAETRSKKAIPVLITPVARRKFNAAGKVEDTHAIYAEIVRQTALENKVLLIDLDKESMDLIQQFGPENSKLLFNHLQAGENPNYPEGKQDDTHFNELGARKMAQLVFADLKKLHLDLANHVQHSAETKK